MDNTTRKIQLDPRLAKCAEFVREGVRVADIGTDHGYLPIALLQSGKAFFAVAADINREPLDSAVRNAQKYGVTESMKFVLSDGLQGVSPEDADDVVIAGMGGELILRIVSNAPWILSAEKHLVLQPMTTAAQLRRGLAKFGFWIDREEAVFDGKKIYSVISAVFTGEKAENVDAVYEHMGRIVPGSEHSARYAQSVLHNLTNKRRGMAHTGCDTSELQFAIDEISRLYAEKP